MWHKSRPFSTCGSSHRGAAALLLVLGVMTILLVLGAVAANSARQELRLSRGEASAEQVAVLVESGFNWAAKQADLNPAWPAVPFVSGSTPCTPVPPYPSYCVDAMARRPVSGTEESVPIRVAYQISANDAIGESFGWIVIDDWYDAKSKTTKRAVIAVLPYRAWCEPAAVSGVDPCVYGG